MKLTVKDTNGNQQGEFEVKFELVENGRGTQAVHDTVVAYQAAQRMGTACAKTAGEVSGSNKKPWRQKGTGRARQGSSRASHWVGGGKAMGPQPRDYTYRPPRQVRRAAVASVLSLRAREKSLFILDAFPSEGKAKAAFEALTKGLALTSALVVDEKKNEKLHRAVRNLRNFDVLPPEGVNLESVLRRKVLVLTSAAAKALETALLKKRAEKA